MKKYELSFDIKISKTLEQIRKIGLGFFTNDCGISFVIQLLFYHVYLGCFMICKQNFKMGTFLFKELFPVQQF